MKHWLKLFVAISLAITIPLQGVAGIIMPVCDMSQDNMTANIFTNIENTNSIIDPLNVITTSNDLTHKSCGEMSDYKTCPDQKCSSCHTSFINLPNISLHTAPLMLANKYHDLISNHYQTLPTSLFHPPKYLAS